MVSSEQDDRNEIVISIIAGEVIGFPMYRFPQMFPLWCGFQVLHSQAYEDQDSLSLVKKVLWE